MTALLMVIIFLMLILPHELAHFIVARVSGMRVDRLSVGFGPKIWSIKRKGTEYALRLFPIGGYVNIAGMDRSKQEAGDGFYSKSVPRQLAVVIAGSVMNFVLAILLFAVVFMVGYQAVDLERATVGGVISGSPAEEAGLVAGDRIVSIDGRQIETWPQISQYLDGSAEQVYELVVLRDTHEIAFAVTPRYYPEYDRKLVGISPPTILVRYDPITAIGSGGKQVILVMGAIVDSLWRMVTGREGIDVTGPVGIAGYVSEASQQGITSFLSLAALLSINLGLINLAPIPALDGGRVVFILVEAVRKKPVKIEFQGLIHYVGFVVLIGLLLFVTYRDIARLLP